MGLRFLYFSISQLLGGLLGWYVLLRVGSKQALIGAIPGILVAGMAWFLVDLVQGGRLLQWLRVGDTTRVGTRGGFWGELTDRARRQLKARDQKIAGSIRDGM